MSIDRSTEEKIHRCIYTRSKKLFFQLHNFVWHVSFLSSFNRLKKNPHYLIKTLTNRVGDTLGRVFANSWKMASSKTRLERVYPSRERERESLGTVKATNSD